MNGLKYSELPEQIKKGIDRRYISSIILLQETAKSESEANRLKQLVFERIKEELAIGTPVREAIETGFARAFWTILDANLTTAVAGLMLLNFGTGPIRGFAVTLIIGIVCTVYTAYFVSKIAFEFYMDKTRGQKVSI